MSEKKLSSGTYGRLPIQSTETEDRSDVLGTPLSIDTLQGEYILTAYRWPVLIMTLTAFICSTFIQNCFGAIASRVSDIFSVKDTLVVMCNLVFYICLFIMTIPSMKIIETIGIRPSIIIAAAITVAGAWLRQLVMINDNFVLILIFSIPPALVQVIFMQLTAKIPNLWFPDNQRVLATSTFGLGSAFAGILGFTIPAFFINDNNEDDPIEEQQQSFYEFLFVMNGIISVLTLPIIFIIRERPKHPPSRTAFKPQQKLQMSMLRQLGRNKNFILFVLYYTCYQIIFSTFSATVSFLVEPYDYGTGDVSIIAMCFILFGVISSFGVGVFIDRTKKFKLTLVIIAVNVTIFMGTFFFTLPYANVILTSINAAIVGMCVLGAIPLGFAYSVQITYPIPEFTSNGIMLMFAQMISFLITLGLTPLTEINPLYTVGVLTGVGAVSLLAILLSKEDLRLQRAQSKLPQAPDLDELLK